MANSNLSDYFKFNPITNPAGGFNFAAPTPSSTFKPAAPINFNTPLAPMTPANAKIAQSFSPPAPAAPTPPISTPSAPVAPVARPAPAPVAPPAPVPPVVAGGAPSGSGATGVSTVPAQWKNADGSLKTPDQIASDVANALKTAHTAGDVGSLALQQFGGNGGTTADAEAAARQIGNTRNDIAVGQTDPYKVASQSGISYTPAELSAIEKAYAGVYDPALDTALAKVTAKQASDKAASDQAAQAAQIKEQGDQTRQTQQEAPYTLGTNDIRYDSKGNVVARGPESASTTGADTGVYVPGANPVVDSWAQRIFDGTAKITDIPATDKGLRNAVVVALQASGNDLAGHPTVTELGKSAKASAQALLDKLDSGTGTSAVGLNRVLFGGLAVPGSDKQNFEIDFQHLKDVLALDGVKYLKGQGSVSDAERALLASGVTKLNLKQSQSDFRSTLLSIISQLSGTSSAAGTSGGITVDAGGQTYTFPDQASADAFKKEAKL